MGSDAIIMPAPALDDDLSRATGGEGGTHPQRLIGPCFRWLFLSRLVMCITSVPDCKGMRAEMA